jgi:hypothetical protein
MYQIFGEYTFYEVLLTLITLPTGILFCYLGSKEEFLELRNGDISWDKTDIIVGLIGRLQTLLYYTGLLLALIGAIALYRILVDIVAWFIFGRGYLVVLVTIFYLIVLGYLIHWIWTRFKKLKSKKK